MAATIRDRLTALAAPIGIALPEEYIAFVTRPPKRGILIHHLCNDGDDSYEWWPETIKRLEAGWGEEDKAGVEIPSAHLLRATADDYAEGRRKTLPGPGGTRFRLDRLRNGFWIGEVDGDSVFIDLQTLGVFAFLQHEDSVVQWASSFGEFAKRGQQR
ncbi:MAG: hypothetical protein K8U57_11920 [Planctomycetes bacterium]|nr:hypothetical protein [Planctomycetota bacterium]